MPITNGAESARTGATVAPTNEAESAKTGAISPLTHGADKATVAAQGPKLKPSWGHRSGTVLKSALDDLAESEADSTITTTAAPADEFERGWN